MRSERSADQLDDLIDLERHPIHDRQDPRRAQLIEEARVGLRAEGCAVVPGLISPTAIATLSVEIAEQKGETHYSTQTINPYFHTEVDPSFPRHHPVNTFIERSSGFIPGDAWPPNGAMATLFRSPEMAAFLAECLEVPALHCYADPLAGLTANILDPAQQFTWHFDTNEFAVTVLVDEADDGGLFQYVPGIRTPDDEGFDHIQLVLDGSDLLDGEHGVRTLDLRPGDMQIFRGRHALHRVTRVGAGSRPRHAAILAYTEEPGVIGRVARTRQLFGRVLQTHLDAEVERVRSDALLD